MAFLFFISIIIATVFAIIIIFSSKKLSPIPYFPSNKRDLSLIIKSLKLKHNQIIYDLGAGDGIIIFTAAGEAYRKKLNTKFVAVEINPILLLILHLRRFFHPNKQNIKILNEDIFKLDYNSQTMKQWSNRTIHQYNNLTVYLYISPWFIEKTLSNIKNQLKNFAVVSYMYPVKSLKKKEKIARGFHSVFIYNL